MASQDDELIPIEKHTTFNSVAYTSLRQVERFVNERAPYEKALEQENGLLTEDDRDLLAMNRAAEERSAVVTVIFSALPLDAFINDYAISSFSRNLFATYLDKLDPVSKWVVVPWLRKGKTINRAGQAFELLRNLFRLRNKLVHFKSTKKRVRDLEEDDRIAERHAVEAIRTVRRALAELRKLDGSVSTRWLSECEKVPEE